MTASRSARASSLVERAVRGLGAEPSARELGAFAVEVADRHQAGPRVPERGKDRRRRVDTAADDTDRDIVWPVTVGDRDRLGRRQLAAGQTAQGTKQTFDVRFRQLDLAPLPSDVFDPLGLELDDKIAVISAPPEGGNDAAEVDLAGAGTAELAVGVDVAQRYLLEPVPDDREAVLRARAGPATWLVS